MPCEAIPQQLGANQFFQRTATCKGTIFKKKLSLFRTVVLLRVGKTVGKTHVSVLYLY